MLSVTLRHAVGLRRTGAVNCGGVRYIWGRPKPKPKGDKQKHIKPAQPTKEPTGWASPKTDVVPVFSKLTPAQTWHTLRDRTIPPHAIVAAFYQLSRHAIPRVKIPPLCERVSKHIPELNARDIATVFLGAHNFKLTDKLFWTRTCQRALVVINDFDGRQISNAMHALSSQPESLSPKLITALTARAMELPPGSFNPQGVSNTMGALAKLRFPQEKLVSRLCAEGLPNAQDFSSQAIAITLRSLAKFPFEFDDHSLIPALLSFAQQRMREFTPQGLASMLVAYEAFAPAFYEELLVALLEACTAKCFSFNEQDIAASFSALSMLNNAEGDLARLKNGLLKSLCKRAKQLADGESFDAQNLPIVFSALAKTKINDPTLITGLCASVREHAASYNSWGISNVLHALAKFRVEDEKTVRALCASALGKPFTPIGIATCLNSLAKLKIYDEAFVTQLRTEAVVRAQDFRPQEIANTINALSKFDVFDKELLNLLCNQGLEQVDKFSAQAIGNILFALSKFEMRHLLGIRLCEAAHQKVKQFNPQNIADVLHAMAYFNFNDEPLIEQLCNQAELLAHQFSDYDCNVLLTALKKLGVQEDPEFVALLSHGREKKSSSSSSSSSVRGDEEEEELSEVQWANLKNFTAKFRNRE